MQTNQPFTSRRLTTLSLVFLALVGALAITPAHADCPPGQRMNAGACVAITCAPGRTLVDAAHCCWPSQTWSAAGCTGKPTACPEGRTLTENDCAAPAGGVVAAVDPAMIRPPTPIELPAGADRATLTHEAQRAEVLALIAAGGGTPNPDGLPPIDKPTQFSAAALTKTASGLEYLDLTPGTGAAVEAGAQVSVHYSGWLTNGVLFDSSVTRGKSFSLTVGAGSVIKGWDEGLVGMRVGGRRLLIIPANIAYGATARGKIPSNATLVFEVFVEKSFVMDKTLQKPALDLPAFNEATAITTPSGLKYIDLAPGKGEPPKKGQSVIVHYTGWLKDGKRFDSSVERDETFSFPIGQGRVIKGWDEGVGSMLPGGRRLLIIPAELGYGSRGAGGAIPPDSTLIFEVTYYGAI